ncbi:MAG: DUF6298 domain-containing protein [Bacteroidota bacterium]|nr:DUF6298 domain-containing protein [Bacteroidota bacterium]
MSFIFFVSISDAQLNGVLRVHPTNPRYFTDDNGEAILLTGSHTWSTLVDNGGSDPPPQFNYQEYLDTLTTLNHNFFRMWTWEQSRWSAESYDSNYWFSPSPFARTGPGIALDGKPKFDLDQFNQTYFDTLRSRIIQAGDRGIYVSIMLFNGWSGQTVYVNSARGGLDPYKGHPFHVSNNISDINGDAYPIGDGRTLYTLYNPAVTAKQLAYVKKVIDEVNDLDNVLYEICNEAYTGSSSSSTAWQYLMIDTIHAYESRKPKQHPVGMTAQWPDLTGNGYANSILFASDADWISPNSDGGYMDDIPSATGAKVIILDTDHLWGVGGDRSWAWKAFMRGMNPIYMDVFDGKAYGCGASDFDSLDIYSIPRMLNLRKNLGYIRSFAQRMNLTAMVPRGDLVTYPFFCLANPSTSGGEYIVFLRDASNVDVNLTGGPTQLTVEWFNTLTGETVSGNTVAGGAVRSFTSPFINEDEVLYLYDATLLPVELISFVGTSTSNNTIRLEWTTATEINNYGFQIERRKGGSTMFESVPSGFVEGYGSSNIPHSYVFIDRNVTPGNYSYKLKQIDNDGVWKYSTVVNVQLQPASVSLKQNYPNPFNSSTMISFELPLMSDISLTMYNTLGQKIKSIEKGKLDAGEHIVHWNGENDEGVSVGSGVYVCRLVVDGAVMVRKIVMVR